MIYWSPQPKQAQALKSNADEILFGGARGGGKTDAGMAWMLYEIKNPNYRGLVIRRNYKDLGDWIDRARQMYQHAGGKYVSEAFHFPSGAVIRTGHLADKDAYQKYQGHEYQKILIEELTHISREGLFEKLIGSCRSTDRTIQPQVFCTTNPDGAGHEWVKKRWEIPDVPKEVVRTEKNGRIFEFIPSTLHDNRYLMENDPGYLTYLESMGDEELKRAWIHGSWEGFNIEGAFYAKQLKEARIAGRITDVPYEPRLPVYTYWDLGMADSTAILFFQVNVGQWRLFDAYSGSGEGLAFYADVLEKKGYSYAQHFAPHDIQVRELGTGKSRLETAESFGISFDMAPNLRVYDGIDAVRTKFKDIWIDQTKCADFLEAIAHYRKEWDEKRGEFKSNPLHDWTSHYADALRYWAVTDIYVPDRNMEFKVYQNRHKTKSMR